MRWHAEWFLSLILAIRLIWCPDGRKWFEGLIWCNLLMEFAQVGADRFGFAAEAAQIWYLGRILEGALIVPVILEASDLGRRWHFWILVVWLAASMECAWLRFYPFTGTALVLVNSSMYCAWLVESVLNPWSVRIRSESSAESASAIDRRAASQVGI